MVTITSDMPIKYFDTLEYVRAAKRIKDPEKLAAYQVKQMEAALETVARRSAFDRRGLATKKDIRALEKDIDGIKEKLGTFATKDDLKAFATRNELETALKAFATKEDLKDLRYDTLKFVVWTGATILSILSGMLAKGFHWF
jgi:hypothetical protein